MKATLIKKTKKDRLFDVINYTLLGIIALVVIYPLYFIVIASFSDPNAVYEGRVILFPKDISFEGYQKLFQDTAIWTGYLNTIIYTVVGTTINVCLTITAAYALSNKQLPGNRVLSLLITFTMFFSGGLIPSYLLVKDLNLTNTMWAIILPGAVGPWNLIVAKAFFQNSIPDELKEAAYLDGCSDFKLFKDIVLPLSKAIIAVITLFYAVGHWNSYFSAMIYLTDEAKYPLQLILRNILIQNEVSANMLTGDATTLAIQQRIADQIKYGVIIVASAPILAFYPFIQKYFNKGVMLGAVKG